MIKLKTNKEIKKEIERFTVSSKKGKIQIKVPKGFKIRSVCNPFGLMFRKTMLLILSKVPPMEVKRKFFCLMGYNFGKDVCLPGYINITPYFPRLVKLEEGVLTGGMTTIYTHSLKNNVLTIGKVVVKRRVLLGGLTTIYPGVIIEENVLTGMNSLITKNVPKNSFVIKKDIILKQWSEDERERFFGESKNDPNFPKKVKELTKKFRKDKKLRFVKFKNDGNRLNAGCEWWRARPVWRIYYNGVFVELALLCPFEFGRKLLYFCMGQNLFGKNIKLGKNVVFDHIYGDMVSIGKNVNIGNDVFLDGHEYTTSETIYGKAIIKDDVTIKNRCYIREHITIGRGAILESNSFAMKDIGPGEIWQGAPAKLIGHVRKTKK